MNQPSPATEAIETTTALPSFDERLASVNSELEAASSETAGELGEGHSSPAAPQVPPAVSDDAAAKRAEERRARLAEIQSRERQRVNSKSAQAAADKLARDLEAAQRRADEAEKLAAARLDRALLKDPHAVLGLMEREGMSAEDVANAIRESMSNPEKAAEAAALRATTATYDPKLAALEARIAEQQAKIDAFTAAQEKAQAAAEEKAQTEAFLGFVAASAERSPMAAKLLETDPEEFMQMASIAAEGVAGLGPEALLDAVEELLDGPTRQVAQKYAALYGLTSQPAAPTQPTTRAAAQANTVSNSLAQQRASIVEEEDFAKLPLEERAARLIRSM